MKTTIATWLIAISLLTGCQPAKKSESERVQTQAGASLPYDLSQPTARFDLPSDLDEVSGLSYYKDNQLACVQDEAGVVFVYDFAQKKIVDEHVFGKKGDYEGVEWVNGEFYVLRSDGELYHFRPVSGTKDVAHIEMDLPGKNDVEGLGYDPKLNALLLATKDASGKKSDKPIYYYDLKNSALWQGPVLKQDALRTFENNSGTGEVKPSGIAVHPQTGEYYTLASQGHRLLVLNRKGDVLVSARLEKSLFPQPEAICFAPDGTLFIANEGLDGGTLLQFKPTSK